MVKRRSRLRARLRLAGKLRARSRQRQPGTSRVLPMPLLRCACGQTLSCQDDRVGQCVTCPYCEARTLVQHAAAASAPAESTDLFPDLSDVGLMPEDPAPA